ncbi:MAG: helix-turn-helix transcriptional regulator [Bacteroidetes bacterium]|nr:helix-turn-helix transcriptional regulator [Bacteroidota bacterium]
MSMLTVTDELERPGFKSRLTGLKAERKIVVKAVKALIKEIYNGDFCFGEGFSFRRMMESRLLVPYAIAETWFIESEDKTIARAILDTKINKVKELLVYTDLPIEAIAAKLNYASTAHLSDELIQHTGLTPGFFLAMKERRANLALRQRAAQQ